jgi:hypothetical protein
MPPKGHAAAAADMVQESVLQAVVLGDGFGAEKRWGPLVIGNNGDGDDEDDESEEDGEDDDGEEDGETEEGHEGDGEVDGVHSVGAAAASSKAASVKGKGKEKEKGKAKEKPWVSVRLFLRLYTAV